MEKRHQHRRLAKQEVEESRCLHGENVLTPPQKTSLWSQFLEKFENPIIHILLVAQLLSMIITGVHCWRPEAKGFTTFLEPIGIFFAITLASCMGFFFEVRANKTFDILNTVSDDILVKVIHDGNICQIPKREVVVDDIVILETGEEIPADGCLLETISLQINESTLTGEPIISKTANEADFDMEAIYPSNIVVRRTTVMDGHDVMQVEKVGDAIGYGKVYEGSQIGSDVETPLQAQLKGLAGVISKAGYTIAGVAFIALTVEFLLSDSFPRVPAMNIIAHILDYSMVAATLIMVSVPEGLPISVTPDLVLSMNHMLKTSNLVRKTYACETMGATTVICMDRAGTLTRNQMQIYQTNFYNLEEQDLGEDESGNLIKEGISMNSVAFLNFSREKVKTLGNPTEAVLLLWLNGQHQDYLELRENATILDQPTFSTERKYVATIVQSPLLGKKVLYVKGAPEIVLAESNQMTINGTCEPVAECKAGIEKQLSDYQNQVMRTPGFAYQIIEDGKDETFFVEGRLHSTDLTYLGIVAISDPVCADVPPVVQSCLDAGINVKIVTGDIPGTAKEIGRQVDTWKTDDSDRNITAGPAFEALSNQETLKRVLDLKIMCCAHPTGRQCLVRLLQQKGAVVTVTGDGTNGASALKAAQIGLSMGDGTSVTKETSDITTIDNSFSSITRAVIWGRSLYRNIQKFLLFRSAINVAACLVVLLGSLLGAEPPLTTAQMLQVNLIMDTFAAGALASLPPNERVMKDKPRRNGKDGDFTITRPMAYNIFGVGFAFVVILMGLLFYSHAQNGLTPHDLSWFFSFFVTLQFWSVFNVKAFMEGRPVSANLEDSKSFSLIALLILIGQYLIVTFEGEMFSVIPLSLRD